MMMIRTREGSGGTKYQVILRHASGKTTMRTFRRLTDAKAWGAREVRRAASVPPMAGLAGTRDAEGGDGAACTDCATGETPS